MIAKVASQLEELSTLQEFANTKVLQGKTKHRSRAVPKDTNMQPVMLYACLTILLSPLATLFAGRAPLGHGGIPLLSLKRNLAASCFPLCCFCGGYFTFAPQHRLAAA